jgi:hypothetical protein
VSIAAARAATIGSHVAVAGVVTADAGRLGTPALMAIQDSTAGIVIRLGDTGPRPTIGTWLELAGTLADPYGQLEIRGITAIRTVGPASLPSPVSVDGASLDDETEGLLVRVEGVADSRLTKATSGDLTVVLTTSHGPVRIAADASAGLSTSSFAAGEHLRLTGVAGQRASRKGAADGFRVWLRAPADIVSLGGPAAPSSTGSTPSPAPAGASGATRSVASAILAGSGVVTIEASVTTTASLLDATNRRVIVQDRTAAIEILLPAGVSAPSIGTRIRVSGEVGRAYGAPRIRAATIRALGTGLVSPLELRVGPGAAHEWRLVRVRGDVVDVHRSGDRWTADLLVGGARVPIAGLAGASIPSAALIEGRTATVVGIVRRPYPSATDRRFAIVPRSPADVTIGGPAEPGSGGTVGTGPGPSGSPGSGSDPTVMRAPDLDLVDLAAHAGQTVRVGGLVHAVDASGFSLDDGTAVASVRLAGAAADLAGSIVVGDALSATGRVELDGTNHSAYLAVDDPAGIALVGGLGPDDPPASTRPDPAAAGSPTLVGEGTTDPGAGSAVAAGLAGLAVPELGAMGLILIAVTSLAVTLLRRQRMRRRLAARIAGRLATYVGGAGASPTGVLATSAGGLEPALALAAAGPGGSLGRPVPAPSAGHPAPRSGPEDR